uniref:RB150 n=1 Tax=Ruegeria sp. PR1b TaxID=185588 RepID=Q8KW92_9RHOB|nr:RB150 [Ruegeria sp. PR1b]
MGQLALQHRLDQRRVKGLLKEVKDRPPGFRSGDVVVVMHHQTALGVAGLGLAIHRLCRFQLRAHHGRVHRLPPAGAADLAVIAGVEDESRLRQVADQEVQHRQEHLRILMPANLLEAEDPRVGLRPEHLSGENFGKFPPKPIGINRLIAKPGLMRPGGLRVLSHLGRLRRVPQPVPGPHQRQRQVVVLATQQMAGQCINHVLQQG